MKPTHDALLERFMQAFPEAVIQVEDESHLHVGHAGAAGGAGHFRVRVIDAGFNALQRIARHRLVYDAVSDWMPQQLHALNIIAMTLEEAGRATKTTPLTAATQYPQDKQRGALKTKRDEIDPAERLPKPGWIRVKAALPLGRFREIKDIVRANQLVTVCEEASCPNIGECWSKGTATFMIMGDKCTRRCRFCNVSTGRPNPLDLEEPERLAQTIALMKLNYVVITSVDRDDLQDGGAGHFVKCIQHIRALTPNTYIEILTPDFGGRLDHALEILGTAPPDVLNHNIETVPRLYKEARPGADFQNTLNLLQRFKARHPDTPTKSGLMVGLGETDTEILQVLRELRAHDVDMLTIGQYLQPSGGHMPVRRYVHPDTFRMYAQEARKMGFLHAASGPLVRSSYHADQQAHAAGVF